MEAWCERWIIKINEAKSRDFYFSCRLRSVGAYLPLKGWNIPLVRDVKYLCVIFERGITWRSHIDSIVIKALRTFVRIFSLMKSETLSIKSKLTLFKALITSKTSYACPAWELAADNHLMKPKIKSSV